MGVTTRGYPYPELADIVDDGAGSFDVLKNMATAIDADVAGVASSLGNAWMFGDGSDGAVTITGGTTTLARDMFYNTLHVTSTGILVTNGFRVYCKTSCTVDAGGVIHNDGAAGAGQVLGAGTTRNTVGGSGPGGTGGAIGAAGAVGTGVGTGTIGGSGGNGGASTGGGGTGAVATAPAATFGSIRAASQALTGQLLGSGVQNVGGGCGGGGGGGGTGVGGGGGGGGGFLLLVTRLLVNNGTIRSNGGNGGNAAAGGNGGGGGGGGGGVVLLVTPSSSGAGTRTVNGGLGGAKDGTGNIGVAGAVGLIVSLVG